jgi:hypothetical protein
MRGLIYMVPVMNDKNGEHKNVLRLLSQIPEICIGFSGTLRGQRAEEFQAAYHFKTLIYPLIFQEIRLQRFDSNVSSKCLIMETVSCHA